MERSAAKTHSLFLFAFLRGFDGLCSDSVQSWLPFGSERIGIYILNYDECLDGMLIAPGKHRIWTPLRPTGVPEVPEEPGQLRVFGSQLLDTFGIQKLTDLGLSWFVTFSMK